LPFISEDVSVLLKKQEELKTIITEKKRESERLKTKPKVTYKK